VATLLRGKHKVEFTPHIDTGDFVIIINAAKVKLTGKKNDDKMYYRHTEWAGHIRSTNAAALRKDKPTEIVKFAVRGMLPKGALGHDMFSKLKVYPGAAHPHSSQKPEVISL
jgi:large subunit ribosomal protein L13